MAKIDIVGIVEKLAVPIVEKLGLELVDVEYLKEGGNWYLRIYIDKLGGIHIDNCKEVSENLGKEIDELDPIKTPYFLEVSSPGLERPLKKDKDFEKYKGEEVELKVFEQIDGKKVFTGILQGLINEKIVIDDSLGNKLEFPRVKVAIVKRTVKF